MRLPDNVPPEIVVWDWRDHAKGSDGYEEHIEMTARHSGANLMITPFGSATTQVTDESVRENVKNMNEFASQFGIGLVFGLDIRHAAKAFGEAYPDELQEMLRLREVGLKAEGEVTFSIKAKSVRDRYTKPKGYKHKVGRLVRVYAYKRTDEGILPDTVQDITARCPAKGAKKKVDVSIPCDERTAGKTACVITAFTYVAADVFAPHIISFQREIVESYRHIPLAGARKDEWGFPMYWDGNPTHDDHWYSRYMAKAYAERTSGRDLVRDCLLMTYGEVGREAERQAAINHLYEMRRLRNGEIEQGFYDAVKSAWGPKAAVGTHPCWWPYPDRREFTKNSLHWWITPRDWAQTDEATPFCIRTSLAKKWNSPIWINMFYSPKVPDYQAELWSCALAGGRVDYHQLWPVDKKVFTRQMRFRPLFQGNLMRGDCRVRLLNFITRSPLDCPVAVVFGQPCAMNWAGPGYEDVGLQLTDALWQAGYPADLIPTTEIWPGSLKVSEKGYIQYGPQRYHSVVLYNPEFDKPVTAEFFRKAAKGKTAIYRIGDWTRDFDGKDFDGSAALPDEMTVLKDTKDAVGLITKQLELAGFVPQVKAERTIDFLGCRSAAPPAQGVSHLIDGTHIIVSGVDDAAGDPIRQTIDVNGHEVTVDAIGLVGIRLDKQGHVEAFAGGGLKSMTAGDFKIELSERVDLALWSDEQGQFKGVLQGHDGTVPATLAKLTDDWLRLAVPTPLPD